MKIYPRNLTRLVVVRFLAFFNTYARVSVLDNGDYRLYVEHRLIGGAPPPYTDCCYNGSKEKIYVTIPKGEVVFGK